MTGPVALWARKGATQRPKLHRAFGYAWVTLMVVTAFSALFILDRSLPNIGTSTTTCTSNPIVTATAITGPDSASGAQVSVQYQSISLIPIPGILAKQFTITRIAKMRLRT